MLAEGGFGKLYEAVQLDLNRTVVVKLLHASDDEADRARFVAEARITAQLRHPQIVVCLDHGSEGDVPWIAYELLPGRDLGKVLESSGPLPVPEAIEAVAQVCAALEEAHRHAILHRDVKPENVIQIAPGAYKVTDFGIAHWSGAGVKTKAGVILGSPAYVAPEVIRGDSATAASDLYAAGILLYELVSGKLPFENASLVGLLELHLHQPPPPISAPPGVQAILARALAKDPRARYPDAASMQAALRELLGPIAVPRTAALSRPQEMSGGRLARQGSMATISVTAAVVERASSSKAARRPGARPGPPRGALVAAGALGLCVLALVGVLATRSPRPVASLAPPSVVPPRPAAPAMWPQLARALEVVERLRASRWATQAKANDVWTMAMESAINQRFDEIRDYAEAEVPRCKREGEEANRTAGDLVETSRNITGPSLFDFALACLYAESAVRRHQQERYEGISGALAHPEEGLSIAVSPVVDWYPKFKVSHSAIVRVEVYLAATAKALQAAATPGATTDRVGILFEDLQCVAGQTRITEPGRIEGLGRLRDAFEMALKNQLPGTDLGSALAAAARCSWNAGLNGGQQAERSSADWRKACERVGQLHPGAAAQIAASCTRLEQSIGTNTKPR